MKFQFDCKGANEFSNQCGLLSMQALGHVLQHHQWRKVGVINRTDYPTVPHHRRYISQNTPHYCDLIMTTIASQITILTIVYSIVYSDADQIKHQSSASLAFVLGIHRRPLNSPHKRPVTRKMFLFDDVIMRHSLHAGSGAGCAMYTLEGTKQSRSKPWTLMRNSQRTSLTPNNNRFYPHASLMNIVCYSHHASYTPTPLCINCK